MFDIGWSELVVIAVVALVAIGPKELPGVLRMVGQWLGKARKMASEFQGQFNEAMREAEMADLKQSFDEIKDAAGSLDGKSLLGLDSVEKDVKDALTIDEPLAEPTGAISLDPVVEPVESVEASEPLLLTPTDPEPPTPATFVEAEAHIAASEPLAVVKEFEPEPVAVIESAPVSELTAEADKADKGARAS